MKTSLILDDKVYEDAKKESLKTGRSLSEIISQWTALGRDSWKKQKKNNSTFKPANLGNQKLDLTNRKEWMEQLDDDFS